MRVISRSHSSTLPDHTLSSPSTPYPGQRTQTVATQSGVSGSAGCPNLKKGGRAPGMLPSGDGAPPRSPESYSCAEASLIGTGPPKQARKGASEKGRGDGRETGCQRSEEGSNEGGEGV